jgi:hypothetical protein
MNKIIDSCYALVMLWSKHCINSDEFAREFNSLCRELQEYDEDRYMTAFREGMHRETHIDQP